MKSIIASTIIAAASLTLTSCGGWVSTSVGGGYYPDGPLYVGPSLPPAAPCRPLPPAGGPAWAPGNNPGTPGPSWRPTPGGNRPGNPGNPGGPGQTLPPQQPAYNPNGGQGNRPMATPAREVDVQRSGATRLH